MTTPEGRPATLINKEAIEDIQDYTNPAIRKMLENAGMAKTGDIISTDDYEATKTRATHLATESKTRASAEALLLAAFVDRMNLIEKFGDEVIKNVPNEALRSIMYVDTGYNANDEELEMLRKSPLSLEQWVQERTEAKKANTGEFDVAVNEEDSVIARGDSPKEALRKGLDARG